LLVEQETNWIKFGVGFWVDLPTKKPHCMFWVFAVVVKLVQMTIDYLP